jgi:hypothetical protein
MSAGRIDVYGQADARNGRWAHLKRLEVLEAPEAVVGERQAADIDKPGQAIQWAQAVIAEKQRGNGRGDRRRDAAVDTRHPATYHTQPLAIKHLEEGKERKGPIHQRSHI